jgi:hypothetical protein
MASEKIKIKKVLTHDGQYDTTIHFIPYDWFSGDINDIIVQCITKEGV